MALPDFICVVYWILAEHRDAKERDQLDEVLNARPLSAEEREEEIRRTILLMGGEIN